MNSSFLHAPAQRGARSELQLLNHSYVQVAEVFAGCEPVPKKHRGGIPVNLRVKSEVEYLCERRNDFHVESSFTAAQQPYVRVTIGALHRLALGQAYSADRPRPSISEDIVSQVLSENRTSFGEALSNAMVGLYDRFYDAHPNMIPALAAMSEVGGIEGSGVAFRESKTFMSRAVYQRRTGGVTSSSLPAADQFFLVHPPYSKLETYEVQCAGKAFARGLMQQALKAANTLAGYEAIASTYTFPDSPSEAYVDFGQRLRQKIAEITASAAAQLHES